MGGLHKYYWATNTHLSEAYTIMAKMITTISPLNILIKSQNYLAWERQTASAH